MSSKTKATKTNENSKSALVPELRFPEFREAEGWKKIPIGEKVDLLSGYPFDGPDITQDNSGTRLLRGINITEGRIRHSPEIDRYYNGTVEGLEKFKVRINDLVIGMDGSKVGKNSALISKEDENALLIQRVARLRASKAALIQFIFQQINSTTFHTYVDKINTSSGIPHISAKQIKDFAICFPTTLEQQKIAECLSSSDKLIAAQARKLDALKTHKNGLMQQLFPREGETQPRLRFPEFQNAGDWEEGKLISLSSEPLSNGVFNDPKKVGTGYKLINVSDMYIETTIDESRLSLLELSPSEFEGNQVVTGDIFFTRSSLVKSGIAVSNIYLGSSSDVTYDGHLIRFRANTSKVVPLFAHYLFKTATIRSQLIARGKTATMTTIGQADVASVTLFNPNPDEQKRIADCLTALDDLIAAETQKLETLKSHKRGLMQQLFPSPEEVVA